MLDWEFEKAGRVWEVAHRRTDCDLSRSRDQGGHDGLGFWLTFEGYVARRSKVRRTGPRARRLVRTVPGPFLYTQAGVNRRRPLGAFRARRGIGDESNGRREGRGG